MLEEWQKVARMVGLKSERYCMKLHNVNVRIKV